VFRLACLITAAATLSGCLIIPVPTPGHSYGSAVSSSTLDSLKPGEVSRTDVLLAIGEPTRRSDNDHYLIYAWTVVYGYGVLFVGAGYSGGFLPMPVTAPNYLCLEFGPDATLIRRENFTGDMFKKMENPLYECENKLKVKNDSP
jgi:hypothetical protein